MRLVVQKYGGTSVGTPDRIRNVAHRLIETQRERCQVVAVISPVAGVTDNFLKLAHASSPQPTQPAKGVLLSTRQHAPPALNAMAFHPLRERARSINLAQAATFNRPQP